ncbi:hypothetical protein G9A89_000570 [Geosiphon pyriformis]|nr:hypothetical protein G9A89_000570 [Geosiphon pyriformis]
MDRWDIWVPHGAHWGHIGATWWYWGMGYHMGNRVCHIGHLGHGGYGGIGISWGIEGHMGVIVWYLVGHGADSGALGMGQIVVSRGYGMAVVPHLGYRAPMGLLWGAIMGIGNGSRDYHIGYSEWVWDIGGIVGIWDGGYLGWGIWGIWAYSVTSCGMGCPLWHGLHWWVWVIVEYGGIWDWGGIVACVGWYKGMIGYGMWNKGCDMVSNGCYMGQGTATNLIGRVIADRNTIDPAPSTRTCVTLRADDSHCTLHNPTSVLIPIGTYLTGGLSIEYTV